MTKTNAIKKLEKAGFQVAKVGSVHRAVKAGSRDVIEFCLNGGSEEVICIKVRDRDEHDDVMTDYSAGVFMDNITGAIKIAH